jgi:hypothetical protein
MFPFGPGVSICVSISETGKWLGSKGLRKCFQCFQLFPRIGPEYIKSSLQVFFQNSSENMETLETSLETTEPPRLSVGPKWKHKWKQFPKRKHLAYSATSHDRSAANSNAAPEASVSLRV